ncbi:MAG: hypothetical protein JWM34_5072 [Ilumatobacteraceae bacterium]|nr:hypothetical protein [Ilumatobacteraceae bacterium]
MIDLETRLQNAGRILDDARRSPRISQPPARSTDTGGALERVVMAEQSTAHPSRHRVRVLLSVAAAIGIALSGIAVVRSQQRTDVVGPARASTTLSSEFTEPVSTASPPGSVPQSQSDPTTAASTGHLPDLSGPGAGLYIDPAALPDGMTLVSADSNIGPLGGSGAQYEVAETRLARYNQDRSRILATVSISVSSPGTQENMSTWYGPLTPTTLTVDGNAVYGTPSGLTWLDHHAVVSVRQHPQVDDLAAIVSGLVLRPDGGYNAGVLPAGMEQVAVIPGTQPGSGTSWFTGYNAKGANDTDPTALAVQIIPHPAKTAEAQFADAPSDQTNAHAIEIGGRRMIVTTTRLTRMEVSFDLSDGDEVILYQNGEAFQEDQMLHFAAALRRSDETAWTRLTAQASANRELLNARTWTIAPLKALGLKADRPSIPIPVDDAITIAAVPAVADDGSRSACEFLHQQLVACTKASAQPVTSATLVTPTLLRVADGTAGEAQVRTTSGGTAGSSFFDLFAYNLSNQKVSYINLTPGDHIQDSCVTILTNDAVIGGIRIADTPDTSAPCPNQPDAPSTTSAISPVNATNSSVPDVTNASVTTSPSASAAEVTVPLLTGLILDNANEKLSEVGLRPDPVTYQDFPFGSVNVNRVISQSIAVGQSLASGSAVGLVVGRSLPDETSTTSAG